MVYQWELLQIKLGRFPQIGNRFFDSFSLAHCPHFRTISDIKVIFLVQHSGKGTDGHLARSWNDSLPQVSRRATEIDAISVVKRRVKSFQNGSSVSAPVSDIYSSAPSSL